MKSMRSIQISLTHLSLRRFALVGIVGLSLSSAVAADRTVTFKDDDGTVIWTESIKEGECAFPPSDPVKFGCDFAGWSDGSQVKSYVEIDQLPVTAAKTWTATYVPHEGRRLRAVIYSGPGANGGACLNYHRLFRNNPRIEYKHYHSDRIRTESGLLNTADMLLIPGGTTAGMWSSLDTAGRKAIADFVQKEGGRYFGTCAGTAFQMNDTSGSHMGLAPFKNTSQTYHDAVTVTLTEKGQEIFGELGWDGSVDNRIYYSNSPIMEDSKAGFKAGTYHFDVLATYKSGLASGYTGKYAMVVGTNYLGRLFLTAPHPEVYEESRKFITTGVRWLFNEGVARNGATAEELKAASTGLTFTLPTTGKNPRALKVAYGPAAFTDVGAEQLLELMHAIDQHHDYVLTPKTGDNITAGQLLDEGFDVLVVPKYKEMYTSAAVTAFKNAGGKVFYEASVGADGVMRGLRAIMAAQPVPMEGHEDWGMRYPLLGIDQNEEALAFTKTGEDMAWTVPAGVTAVECLVVGGGGGGGRSYAGGGGAGGLIHRDSLAVEPGSTLTIRVGAGGAGGVSGAVNGQNGEATSVVGEGVNLVAAGGGGGGTAKKPGADGASGGGSGGHGNSTSDAGKGVVYAGGAGTDGQGGAGGSVKDFNGTGGAGGGGAGGAGTGCAESGVYAGRAGGAGVNLEITGMSVGYAGGGGGGGGYASTAPAGGTATCGGGAGGVGVKGATTGGTGKAGKAGTGGGGGGGGRVADGGAGGSGIVIIRYTLDPNAHRHLYGVPQVIVAPSCTNDGYEVSVCTNSCPDVPAAARTNVLFATAHDWSDWVVDVEPTAEAEGLKHRTCGYCGTVEEEEIHFDDPIDPQPTGTVTTNAMANGWGYAITGLGANQRDVALVFTNAAAVGMSWTVPDGVTSIQYLVIGGGGAGGSGYAGSTRSNSYPDMGGGGGGAGAGFEGTVAVSANDEIPVVVGVGGVGAVSAQGGDGGESSLTVAGQKIAAAGGGGGGRAVNSSTLDASLAAGRDGGCGGGGTVRCKVTNTTADKTIQAVGASLDENRGKAGGRGYIYISGSSSQLCYGGGGGGITEAGHVAGGGTGNRFGGAGLASSITGEEVVYGGGGGGGGATGTDGGAGGAGGGGKGGDKNTVTSTRGCGYPGTDGLGGGGGGGTGYSAATDKSISFAGGNGGSGVVIIRYTAPQGEEPKEGWSEDPAQDERKAASKVYPQLATSSVLGSVDAGTLGKWAKAKSVNFTEFMDAPGSFEDAFLLDCAVSEVEDKKAEFRFAEIVPGVTPTIGEGGKYGNGKVVVYGMAELGAGGNWEPADDDSRFFKAKLVPVRYDENLSDRIGDLQGGGV